MKDNQRGNTEYFIDTNVFLRFLVKENATSFKECERVIRLTEAADIKAATSDIVIAEIEWTLNSYYKIPKPERIAFLESISSLKSLSFINHFNTLLALRLYKTSQAKFIDCLIASLPNIQSNQTIVVSYDTDFEKLGVKRISPKEI